MTVIVQTMPPPNFRFTMASTPSRSPDRHSIHRVAVKSLQIRNVSVEGLEGHVFRTFRLQPSSDYFYILRCRPSSHVRLLRHEEDRLHTEAVVLQTLRGRSEVPIPRLIDRDTSTAAIGSPYLITGPFSGAILSDIEPSLSKKQLASIDKSLGQYIRQLSRTTGPAFGSIRSSNGSSHSVPWSYHFAGLLESVLRDGEDAMISLPYDFIRDQVRRHRHVLDQITQPRLTLLETAADRKILVDTRHYTVSGIIDWSSAIWGDPFMSDCFYQPSVSFSEGFGRVPNRGNEERIRQYLYTMYHALLAVVGQCLRPSEDGDELNARRSLTAALTALGSFSTR